MTTDSALKIEPKKLDYVAHAAFYRLREELNESIIGQEALVEHMLISLLADGHLLVEGAPGLAKTTAIKELAERIEGDFHRLQFTPDLLPGDLTGTDIYRPQDGSFQFQKGPIFHNLVLADEINRAPAKVQSALLEAMGERQITVGQTTYKLPPLFLVMATQNPIEQEGTYPLPEAQLDRFLMYLRVGYPQADTERRIMDLASERAKNSGKPSTEKRASITQEQIFDAHKQVLETHMSEAVKEYVVQLILASRNSQPYGEDLARWISYGASPRGSIALDRCARARAWLNGRDFVTPDDVQAMAFETLRHRILLSFEAEAEGVDTDHIISTLIQRVPVS
jgi:MoxR-like ATPase